jgi:hypothetical protein
MKSMFLSMVVSLLLVPLGLGQAPAPSGNSGPVSVKGCLGGVDGNYTLAEDGTTKTFKITSSTVDLTSHLGHDVELTGPAATVAASSGSADGAVVVTGVNMIADHCAAATAGTTVPVADTTPTATASAPAVADTTPAATASTPVVADASTPAVADTTPTATAKTPADAPSAPMMASAREPESSQTRRLPDTATQLPLLGLVGLGLLATGLLTRRSRTN